jgi:uncharacterized membrane protein
MINTNSQKTFMGILAYLGILAIIPYLAAKEDPFIKFHIKQGLVLLTLEIIVWILTVIFPPLSMLFWIIKVALLVLVIIGIVNVVKGKQENLPLVGNYATYFNI